MNLTNTENKEKQMLKAIAQTMRENSINFAARRENNNGISYYMSSSQCVELTDYSFNTIVELRQILTELWKDNEIMQSFIPVVLAATFKNRPETDTVSLPLIEHKDGDGKEVLPVYTYTL